MRKIPYEFDMRTGHYKYVGYLYEGEAAETADGEQDPEAGAEGEEGKEGEDAASKASVVNLDSPEVVQLKQDKDSKSASFDQDLNVKKSVVTQVQSELAQAAQKPETTQEALNALQKKMLQAQYEYEEKKFEKLKAEHEYDQKIIQAKQALIESRVDKLAGLPMKYRLLTESNIHNAKIYLDNLVGDELDEAPIKDMRTFKKIFKKSDLLYGKDSNGYFAVCVDKQDFEKITNTLEEVGYLRTDIIDTIMPQLFNRTDMIK